MTDFDSQRLMGGREDAGHLPYPACSLELCIHVLCTKTKAGRVVNVRMDHLHAVAQTLREHVEEAISSVSDQHGGSVLHKP